MKRLLFVFGVLGAGLSHSAANAHECFARSAAVFAAHPNAVHASYIRMKKSQRCWYADAFNSEAKAKPASHPIAGNARISAPRPAIAAWVAQPPAVAVARTPRLHTMAYGSASPAMILPFPSGIPPSVSAQELSRLLPLVETPADFDSRFSASGYTMRSR